MTQEHRRNYLVIFKQDRDPSEHEITCLLNKLLPGNLKPEIPGIYRANLTESEYQDICSLGNWDMSPEGIFKLK